MTIPSLDIDATALILVEQIIQTCLLEGEMCVPAFYHTVNNPDDELGIPADFYEAHLSQMKGEDIIIKGADGLDWLISIQKTRGGGTCKLGPGWNAFAASHGIEGGEMIIFWLVASVEMCIEIFGKDGCLKQSTLQMYKEKPVNGRDEKQDSEYVSDTQSGEPESKVVLEEPHEVVSSEAMKKVALAAKNYKTEFPSFHVVLHKSYVTPRCFVRVRSNFGGTYFKPGERLRLLDSHSDEWYVTFLKCSGFHWHRFVEHHDLQAGDACVFEAIGDHTVKVHIFKLKDEGSLWV